MSLQSELQDDPLNRGYAAFMPGAPGVLADMMNARIYTMVKEKFVTARGVLAAHGSAGAAVLDKLETLAASNSEVKWAMRFVTSDGIDVGHANTRTLLDALVPAVLTQVEADLIKNMAVQPASRAEVLGLGYVFQHDVQAALA
jgi:molybdopterin-biosynthesis enzyme MoeA-like protein